MFVLLLVITFIDAGPATYKACQQVCAKAVGVCYSAAGYTFGTVTVGVGTSPAVLFCNAAFGKCQAACAALASAL